MDRDTLNIPETEQWLLEGDCDKCRRESYCSKECTAFKRGFDGDFNGWMNGLMQKAHEANILKRKGEIDGKEETKQDTETTDL